MNDAFDQGIVQSINGLDKLLEHRLRLALCVLLTRFDTLSFSRLKSLTRETDGKLDANLSKLEDAHYLRIRKSHVDRKPVTWYRLTAVGKNALRKHIEALSQVIGAIGG